jgi:small-conductance mechanosensitive channel
MEGLDEILEVAAEGWSAVAAHFTSIWIPIQIGLIAFAALIGWAIAASVRRHINILPYISRWPAVLQQAIHVGIANLGIIVCIAILLLVRAAMQATGIPGSHYLIGVAASLATAWVVISVAASLIRNQFVNRVVTVVAWSVAALSIAGLLDETIAGLDSLGVNIGGLRVTALLAIKTTVLLLLTLWGAVLLANLVDMRLRAYPDLTPSIQVLLGKLFRIALITFAVLVVLSSVGIDFSALALFSGAVGVGVGFGLQKIVSNLVSGIILLADKSIKPGDVITVGESFGWIGTMGARYTSVVGRDGREYLIPNEDFVTQRVINWSYSDDRVRLDIRFGTSYSADPHVVRKLAIDAAANVPRVLSSPAPTCHFHALGESSLEFLLRFWIHDPVEGLGAVRSNVLLALWDSLKREGVEIPYTQHDLHVKEPVRVVVEREAAGG